MPGQQTAQSLTRAAPIGGWNARDSLANMPSEDAIQLDNWFPSTDGVESRKGIGAAFATLTGITKDVDSLAVWNGPGSTKLWAFGISGTNAKRAFDVTAGGATTADATFTGFGLTGNAVRYSQAMFNNTAGYYLMIADNDGDHAPLHYNGTTWAQPTITGTGLTPANLVHVNLFKFRFFFTEKASLNFWYLGLDSIAGAAAKYKLGGYCNEGGYLVATSTWTADGGEGGTDDLFVCVTSKGQIAVFAGNDPSSASSWQIVGVYKAAPPIGRNCFFRYGGDLFILTTDGIFPMSDILRNSASNPVAPITDKIRSAFQAAARSYGSNTATDTAVPGWSMTYYPRGRYIFVNVPSSAYAAPPTIYQYAQNVQTKAWCRFTGQNMRSWAVYLDELYCGTAATGAVATIYKADSAQNDAGNPIDLRARQAFDYFDARGRNKQWTLARPSFKTDAPAVTGALFIDTDFATQNLTPSSPIIATAGGAWDTADWDAAFWDAQPAMITDWSTYGGIGYCASLVVYIRISGPAIAWFSTDWAYRVGGVL